MFRTCIIVLLLVGGLAVAGQTRKEQRNKDHRDYVPDETTALRIAEAVLAAKYGEEGGSSAHHPLLVDGSNKEYWVVQESGAEDRIPQKGGGPAVWINKHSGCLQVMEHMK